MVLSPRTTRILPIFLAFALLFTVGQADARRKKRVKVKKRKVLVFSFFEDTVEWIRDFLNSEVAKRPELADYRGRMVAVSGSGDSLRIP